MFITDPHARAGAMRLSPVLYIAGMVQHVLYVYRRYGAACPVYRRYGAACCAVQLHKQAGGPCTVSVDCHSQHCTARRGANLGVRSLYRASAVQK